MQMNQDDGCLAGDDPDAYAFARGMEDRSARAEGLMSLPADRLGTIAELAGLVAVSALRAITVPGRGLPPEPSRRELSPNFGDGRGQAAAA
jgi:hypothetical protein